MASPDTNQQPSWATYEPTKDCSQGFCSIYCPQWCYIVFPPPPPFSFDEPDDSSGGPTISPLVIAIIGILASAFLLVGYYTLVSKYCGRRRRQRNRNPVGPDAADNNNDPGNRRHEEWPAPPSVGLDEALISKITVCKYRRGDGLVDCADCSVCLGEFQEDESLRLLPKCSHAFHVRCIDTWLRSHSNCPLCRANIAVVSQLPLQLPALPPPPETDDETVVARGELDEGTSLENDSDASSSKEVLEAAIEIGDQRMRRSFSMGSFHRSRVSVADILELDLEDEDPEINRTLRYVPRLIPMKRSVSSGRFCLTRQGRGKNSVLPI